MDEPIKWDSFITPGISFSLGLHLNTANALPAQQTIRVKKNDNELIHVHVHEA